MKKLIAIVFFLLCSGSLWAQKDLSFELDYARFNYDTTSVFLEFYYDLNSKGMYITQTQEGPKVSAIVHFELKNIKTGETFLNKDWKFDNTIKSTPTDSVSKSFMGALGFVVPKGEYTLLVKATDAKNEKLSKSFTETINIEPVEKSKFAESDIELACDIKKEGADPNSIFYKNTLEVIPNPSMVFSYEMPVLFYYTELYNLKLDDPKEDFNLQKLIYSSSGKIVYRNSKNIKQNSQAVVEYGLINLSKLPTDSYNLVFSLIDPKTNKAFISQKRFYVFNPNVVDSSITKKVETGFLGSEFALFSKEECDNMFAEIKYIATSNEIDQYKNLDSVKSKREFLYNFWSARNPNPGSARNDYKEEYMKRVAYANENFSRAGRKGYLTDRGRVLLIYGEPDQKDYYPSEPNLKPYEVWFYNQIEGGVSFVFGDLSGFGNYELLNSTKRGEVQDPNYMDRLATH
ncbi:MAG: GWxTD domain-containing protein [Bacteroidetes bacterium]|nr:GWxTD domain-containing protein [Bacteroidota bacterium]